MRNPDSATQEPELLFSRIFPMPSKLSDLQQAGAKFNSHRRTVMDDRKEGLTKTYNRFHGHGEKSEEIQVLRTLQVEMDQTVAAAYDWRGSDLDHGFHKTKQGVRYTISESARRTVL